MTRPNSTAGASDTVAPYATDHVVARKFAVKWATRDSRGDIANLARAYLRVSVDLEAAERRARERTRVIVENHPETCVCIYCEELGA